MDIIAFYLRLSLADGDLGKNNKDERTEDLSLPGKHKSLEQNCLSKVFFFKSPNYKKKKMKEK